MSESKEITYAEVAEHNSKKDLYMVIHDKVYNASSFVDEHPGGEEVLLDVAGQEASEAFEDVGHSDEAREILEGLLVGTLKRTENDPVPRTATQTSTKKTPAEATGLGAGVYLILIAGAAAAYYGYQYMQANQNK